MSKKLTKTGEIDKRTLRGRGTKLNYGVREWTEEQLTALRSQYRYDPTAKYCIRQIVKSKKQDEEPGNISKNRRAPKHKGYVLINTPFGSITAHRLVWILNGNEPKQGFSLDHINNDPLDNRIENLHLIPQDLNFMLTGIDRARAEEIKSVRQSRNGSYYVYINGEYFSGETYGDVIRKVSAARKTKLYDLMNEHMAKGNIDERSMIIIMNRVDRYVKAVEQHIAESNSAQLCTVEGE